MGVQPQVDDFNTILTDTISLNTSTFREDSLRSDNLSLSIIGSMNDPVFGESISSLIAELRLEENGLDFGASPQIDSLVLVLEYASSESFYGDLNTPQTINVHRLQERVFPDTNYYSNVSVQYDPTPLGSWTGTFKLTDQDSITLIRGGDTTIVPPQLRIPLDNNFFNDILTADRTSNETFLNDINGLVIIPEQVSGGDGAMAYFDMLEPRTSVQVYYDDTLSKSLIISSNSSRISKFEHNYSGTQAEVQINDTDPSANYDLGYVQAMSGTKLRIRIPHVFELIKNRNIAVNSAEIVFTVDPSSQTGNYTVPDGLLLINSDSLGQNDFLKDQILESRDYYGGDYNSSDGTYRFNIVRHIQELLNEFRFNGRDINYGMYLIVPSDNPISASRLILDTRQQQGNRNIKLNLRYTVIE